MTSASMRLIDFRGCWHGDLSERAMRPLVPFLTGGRPGFMRANRQPLDDLVDDARQPDAAAIGDQRQRHALSIAGDAERPLPHTRWLLNGR